jgi:hypothetical protein
MTASPASTIVLAASTRADTPITQVQTASTNTPPQVHTGSLHRYTGTPITQVRTASARTGTPITQVNQITLLPGRLWTHQLH